jgi:demethylmenaquinone methyltransferase/2-methoxy-6-polyprenyl-1,4-benzoquinol methylase
LNDRQQGPGSEPPGRKLSDLDLDQYLNDKSRKQEFVTPMFDTIAPRYDEFTRVFSFGMDASWKRVAIDAAVSGAKRLDARLALDLASGTGDLGIALARELPNVRVTAVDASPNMVAQAKARLAKLDDGIAARITPTFGDMTSLDVADASIDVITSGYGVRNLPDFDRAISEMSRVTRKGATVVTLDFYRPENRAWRALLLWYLSVAGNAVGWLWHRDPVVYGYIAKSIDHFVSWQQFSRMLETHNFKVEKTIRYLGGGVAIHVCTKV